MKTKTFVLILVFILGALPLLLAFKKPDSENLQVQYSSFVNGLQLGSFAESGSWYEGEIHGILLGSGAKTINGKIGFGSNGQEELRKFDGEIGPYEMSLEYLIQDNKNLVRVSSFAIRGENLYPFVETLAKMGASHPNSFIYLRNFYPHSYLGLIFKLKQILQELLPFTTFTDFFCSSKECQIIIDTDLLSGSTSGIDNGVINYLRQAKNQHILYSPKEGKVSREGLEASGVSIDGEFMKHNLNLEITSKGLVKRVSKLSYEDNYDHPLVELQITQEEKKVQHWKVYSSIGANRGSAFIADVLNPTGTNIWLQREQKRDYIPVVVKNNIDVYTLLGK